MNNRKRNRCAISTSLLPVLGALAITCASNGQILVDHNAPGPTHNGETWATAFLDPQDAIDDAVAGDVIHVAEGTYSGTIIVSGSSKNGIRIFGGFAGFGANDPDFRDILGGNTILDGGDTTRVVTFTNVAALDEEPARLDGFVIRNGFVQSQGTPGAGISIDDSSVLIANCRIEQNAAGDGPNGISGPGGGAFVTGFRPAAESERTVYFINCAFRDNTATRGGGLNVEGVLTSGEDAFRTKVQLVNCLFESNVVSFSGNDPTVVEGRGGAMMVRGNASVQAFNCTIADNAADAIAGGIAAVCPGSGSEAEPGVIVRNSILWGNTISPSTAAQLGVIQELGTCQPFTVEWSNV